MALQELLNRYCLINRKYQLIDETQFLSKFSDIKTEYLKAALENSYNKIQNSEIIKNTTELPKNGENEISNRLKKMNFDSSDLYFYLNSRFDVKELKLEDERIERRLRNILAERHQKILTAGIKKIKKKERLGEIKDKIISGIAI